MADTQTPGPELTDDDALRQRLLGRVAVAAVVIVGLLGSLAMFDALYTPRSSAPEKVAGLAPGAPIVEPPAAPAAPVVGQEQKVGAGDTATEAAKPAEAPATETGVKPEPPTSMAAAPEGTAAVGAPPLQPLPQERPLTKPATAKPASIRPSESALPPLAARPDVQREIARPPARGTRGAPASRPVTQAAEYQYALQLGVFSNLANAEELRAKLELAGVPASIEARVRAGPFASRAEADEARSKLQAMGLTQAILISVKR